VVQGKGVKCGMSTRSVCVCAFNLQGDGPHFSQRFIRWHFSAPCTPHFTHAQATVSSSVMAPKYITSHTNDAVPCRYLQCKITGCVIIAIRLELTVR